MCLSHVSETYDHPSTLIMDGWKDIDQRKPRLQFTVKGKSDIPFDKWITATNEHAPKGIKADDGNVYEPGFHVYADEKELNGKTYQRVFVRGVLCVGKQDGKTVIIAKEMYMPSDKNGWPPKGDTRSLMDKVKDVMPGNA
jgi:hypothetical protein